MLTGTKLLIDEEAAEKNASQLYYLNPKQYSEAEIRAFGKKFNLNREELEKVLLDHPNIYRLNYLKHIIANYVSNGFYLAFPLITGAKGLETTVAILTSYVLPKWICYGIGTPLAFIDVFAYMLFYSAHKEAISNTLDYSLRAPYQERLKEWHQELKKSPIKKILESAKSCADFTVMMVADMTAIMSELIYFLPYVPFEYRWPLAGVAGYFGWEYYESYTNNVYRTALQTYKENNHFPIISWEYPSTSIELVFQLASTVALRAYPAFSLLAVESKKELGFWPSEDVVLVCALLNSMGIFLNSTVDYHFAIRNKIFQHLSQDVEIIERANNMMTEYGLKDTPAQLKQIQRMLVNSKLQEHKNLFIQQNGMTYFLKQSPGNTIYLGLRMLFGGLLLYCMTPYMGSLINKQIAQLCLTPVGALAAAFPFYRAEQERICTEQFWKKYQSQLVDNNEIEVPQFSRFIMTCAFALTFISALMTSMSTIGTLEPDATDILKIVIVILCLERILCSIKFNFPKTEDTLNSHKASLSHCYARMFQPASPKNANEYIVLDSSPRPN